MSGVARPSPLPDGARAPPPCLTWNPSAWKSLFVEKPDPLRAFFPPLLSSLPRSLLPPFLSIICLQLSVHHAHLTNDACLRYHIWAKKSDLSQTTGWLTQDRRRGRLSFAGHPGLPRLSSAVALSRAHSWRRHCFKILISSSSKKRTPPTACPYYPKSKSSSCYRYSAGFLVCVQKT